jgi:uncharacterized membrane protein (UPF0127 family)
MHNVTVVNKNHPLPSPLQATYCDTFLCRLRGLMFRHDLDHGEGLLLVESRDSRLDASIHMFFVSMDLAVVWINSKNVVVDTVLAKTWKPYYAPRDPACFILEIHPGRLDEFKIGDQVEFNHG